MDTTERLSLYLIESTYQKTLSFCSSTFNSKFTIKCIAKLLNSKEREKEEDYGPRKTSKEGRSEKHMHIQPLPHMHTHTQEGQRERKCSMFCSHYVCDSDKAFLADL